MSTTSIYACGELNDFVVRKVAHKRVAAQTITGYNTEEFAVSPSVLSLFDTKKYNKRYEMQATTGLFLKSVYRDLQITNSVLAHLQYCHDTPVQVCLPFRNLWVSLQWF